MLQIDKHAAAFGLLQLAIANLDWQITVALARFETVKPSGRKNPPHFLGQKLTAVEEYAKAWVRNRDNGQELYELSRGIAKAREVVKWRNLRIHPPKVDWVDGMLVLLDENGNAIQIDYAECEKNIQLANVAAALIVSCAGMLVRAEINEQRILQKLRELDLLDDDALGTATTEG